MKSRFLGTSVLQFLAVTIGVILLVINVVRGHLYCKKDRWVFSLRAEDEMATSGYQVGDILRSPDTLASCSTKCQVRNDHNLKCQQTAMHIIHVHIHTQTAVGEKGTILIALLTRVKQKIHGNKIEHSPYTK